MRRSVLLATVVIVVVSACSFKPFDFNGDNKADYVWRDQTTGTWYEGSIPDAPVRYAGAATDIPVSADYDGDGKYDIAVVKANGDWVKADGSVIKAAFPKPDGGPSGCCSEPVVPVPGDYDGDKKAEPAWFRTSDGTWLFADGTTASISGGPTMHMGCCLLNLDGDVPVPADYDGDKKTDLAVFDPLTADWTIKHSSDATVQTVHVIDRMGPDSPLQLPIPADYDGVGHAQPAIIDIHGWHIDGHAQAVPLLESNVIFPAPADYDGDGKADLSTIGMDGHWRTPGQPTDTVVLSDASSLRGVPAETPTWLIANVARLTLLGRNLTACAQRPDPSCAGFDRRDAANLQWIDHTTGTWYLSSDNVAALPANSAVRYQGAPTDTPASADYDGDGAVDLAVVKANGDWVRGDGSIIASFPRPTETLPMSPSLAPVVPVPADYDGDGKADPAWYRTTDGTWFVRGRAPEVFGQGPSNPVGPPPGPVDADLPVPADYDGDAKADLARFNPRSAQWTIRSSNDGSVRTTSVTAPAAPTAPARIWIQYPVPADYDGVGHAQPAVFDVAGWHVEGHSQVDPFGSGKVTFDSSAGLGAVPAVADYNSDGRADFAYVEHSGRWFVKGRDLITAIPVLGVLSTGPDSPGIADLRYSPIGMTQVLFANVDRLLVLDRCMTDPTAPCV